MVTVVVAHGGGSSSLIYEYFTYVAVPMYNVYIGFFDWFDRVFEGVSINMKKFWMKSLACGVALTLLATGCGAVDTFKDVTGIGTDEIPIYDEEKGSDAAVGSADGDEAAEVADHTGSTQNYPVIQLSHPTLLGTGGNMAQDVVANVKPYHVEASLSNVTNADQFYLKTGSAEADQLADHMFYVTPGYNKEFYETYETNRYLLTPNFITVDSMMHTYHLYFSYLMKNTERNYLSDMVLSMSEQMLAISIDQYEALKGTEWAEAATRNVAYFATAVYLMGGNASVPASAANMASTEIDRIMSASGIETSSITGDMLDYSQFVPRGYYEGDANLESYFRTMMWYGQVGFKASDEDMTRSAVLMNLAMQGDAFNAWESIYVVTSFFAGASDDLTYYEYMPAIQEAYGEDVTINSLAGQNDAWQYLLELTAAMPSPMINSIPTRDDHDTSTAATDINKGFRFMGQRFTLDEAIFQKLIYESVQPNAQGDTRMLPDVLDVAAALGSDTAFRILDAQGDTGYANYTENMTMLREAIESSDADLWSASLYANWLYTLTPLLEAKGEGYPSFMQSEAWATKNIESFAGSYTELKHDTILYSKQVMAEMGGGDLPEWDDRGYVEPEIDVWARFANLAAKTAEGLETYGLLDSEDEENLQKLGQMAEHFLTMSEKELQGQLLSDDEYELIRNYGGNLEHFWIEAYRDEGTSVTSDDFPAAIVADIATDPNGSCLEVGTGNPSNIYVVVPIGDELHICHGVIYSFYQFEQPISQRLTDSTWRQMMGIAVGDNGTYSRDTAIDQPAWTQGYRVKYNY